MGSGLPLSLSLSLIGSRLLVDGRSREESPVPLLDDHSSIFCFHWAGSWQDAWGAHSSSVSVQAQMLRGTDPVTDTPSAR